MKLPTVFKVVILAGFGVLFVQDSKSKGPGVVPTSQAGSILVYPKVITDGDTRTRVTTSPTQRGTTVARSSSGQTFAGGTRAVDGRRGAAYAGFVGSQPQEIVDYGTSDYGYEPSEDVEYQDESYGTVEYGDPTVYVGRRVVPLAGAAFGPVRAGVRHARRYDRRDRRDYRGGRRGGRR